MSQYFKVGKIVNTQGLKGEVRVVSTTDFADDRYQKGVELALFRDGEFEKLLTIKSHRRHKNFDLLTFEDHPRIEDVEGYRDCLLKVSSDALDEVVGLEIITDEGESLGKVSEILSPGSNDVWVVKQKGKKDLLIPFIEPVVYKIDKENKQAFIHVLEGLFD